MNLRGNRTTNPHCLSGFALPTILIASIVMLTVLLVAVTSTAAVRVALVSQYYNQLSQTAGEAGIAYAKSCLAANNGVPQWTDANPLKPDTDCTGTRLASCPVSPATAACHSVMVNGNTISTFSIGLPQLSSSGQATSITSVGMTNLLRSSDNSVWRQYSQSSRLSIPATIITANIQAWGGGGAGGTIGGWTYGSYGGAGGAAQGVLNITSASTSYSVVVGGGGTINSYSADFKCAVGGGGCASNNNADNRYTGGGGGYSGIFKSSVSQSNALLIAGGGGGGGSVWSTNGTTTSQSGGAGGGSSGQIGYGEVDASYRGQPGTQSAAGATASGTYLYNAGTAGANIQGALQGGTTVSYSYGGGGGGGYWGGSAGGYYTGSPSYPVNQMQGGGGGSGYFNPAYVSSGLLTAGIGTAPGDSGNSLRGSAGNAGGYQGNGTAGVVIISYPTGSMIASGGTITYSGGNTIHTFTSSGVFVVGPQIQVYAWGGGGAGGTVGGWVYGAAGGAGGAAEGVLSAVIGTYSTVVGGGGTVNSYNAGSITCAVGGGGCASWNNSDNRYGSGGGGYSGLFTSSISQANALLIAAGGGGGGSSRAGTGNAGGAGGGAVGQDGYSPYDSKTAYAGKGGTQTMAGADASCDSANTTGGQGALQGGRSRINSYGGAGGGGYWGGSGGGYSEANTMAGGGGGSSYYNPSYVASPLLSPGSGTTPGNSGSSLRGTAGNAGAVAGVGSSGVVVIRYPTGSINATGGTITNSGGYTIHTFTDSGTFTVVSTP